MCSSDLGGGASPEPAGADRAAVHVAGGEGPGPLLVLG